MSLLTMIRDTTDRLSLPRLSTVVGNNNPQAQTLLALANEEGQKLTKAGYWQQLEKVSTFQTVDQQTLYSLDTIAPGWDRQRNPTFWDRTGQNLVNGPITPAEQQTNVAYLPMNVYYEWRAIGDQIEVYPPPAGDLEFSFEYVSDRFCKSSGGAEQDRWLADDDVGILPEYLMSLGIEWRWNQRTGIVDLWPLQKQEYDRLAKVEASAGVQGRAIDLGGQDLFRQRRVPWGDWMDYSH